MNTTLEVSIGKHWRASNRLDVAERTEIIGDYSLLVLLDISCSKDQTNDHISVTAAQTWRNMLQAKAVTTRNAIAASFFVVPTTESYIGCVSLPLYRMIRYELGVPFHQGIVEDLGSEYTVAYDGSGNRQRKTIGSWIGNIY